MFIKVKTHLLYVLGSPHCFYLVRFTSCAYKGYSKAKFTLIFNCSEYKLFKWNGSDVYFAFVYISGVKLQKLEWAIFKYYQQAEYEIVTFFKVNNE